MRLFDTHAHYDSGAFNADRLEVLASMPEQGVELILNPGCDLKSSRTAVELAEQFPFVYAAVGVHPSDCEGFSTNTADELRSLAAHPKVKAVGEIGLDYYWKENPCREFQQEVFHTQMELAEELGLPVIVHDREAHRDCLEVVKSIQRFPGCTTAIPAVWRMPKPWSSWGGCCLLPGSSPTKMPGNPWRSSIGSLWTGS